MLVTFKKKKNGKIQSNNTYKRKIIGYKIHYIKIDSKNIIKHLNLLQTR